MFLYLYHTQLLHWVFPSVVWSCVTCCTTAVQQRERERETHSCISETTPDWNWHQMTYKFLLILSSSPQSHHNAAHMKWPAAVCDSVEPPLIRHTWITPAAHSYKQCMFCNWFNRSKATVEVKFNWTKCCLVEHTQAELQTQRQKSRTSFMRLVCEKYSAVNRKWILILQDF